MKSIPHRILKATLLASALTFIATLQSKGGLIVDTGPATVDGGQVLGYGQGLAGEFQLSGSGVITGLDGWIGDDITSVYDQGGTISLSLLANDPNTGTLLYAGNVSLGDDLAPNWVGISGLDISVSAGDYWLLFNTPDAEAYMPTPVPNPLPDYAFNEGAGGAWDFTGSSFGLGIQVYGQVSSAPDSDAAFILLVCSLIALGAVRSRLNSA